MTAWLEDKRRVRDEKYEHENPIPIQELGSNP
jgi:hypothetical protein